MNTILRKQFLAHVGQTSPEPMMIEVARAEGACLTAWLHPMIAKSKAKTAESPSTV